MLLPVTPRTATRRHARRLLVGVAVSAAALLTSVAVPADAAPAPVWGAPAADSGFSNALPGSPMTPVSAGNLARTWSVDASVGAGPGCRTSRVPTVASAGAVVVTSGTRVRALVPATGATLWTRDVADRTTSVVVATSTENGRVVSVVQACASRAVSVVAHDTASGRLLARRTGLPARDGDLGDGPGLLLSGGSVVLNDRVLDAATLADRWRLASGTVASSATPIFVSAGRVYLRYGAVDPANLGKGEVRDLATGALVRTAARWTLLPTFAAADGTYAVNFRGGANPALTAYDPATGASRPLVPTGLTGWVPAVSGDDVVAPCANAPLKVCRYDRSGARRATSEALPAVPTRVQLVGRVVLVSWAQGGPRGTVVLRLGDLAQVTRLGESADLDAAVPVGTRLLTTTDRGSRLVMLAP